jgi:membrane-associated phospholipid phosphatase
VSGSKEEDPLEVDYVSESLPAAPEEEPEPSSLLYRLANVISVILHPIFMPAILFALVFYFSPRITAPLADEYRWPMFGMLLLMTLVIPLLSTLVLYYLGALPSLRMARRKERVVPFLYIAVFYAFITYFFISRYQPYLNISIMLAGITFIIFLVTIITFYWKVSIHSAAISGVVGFLASFTLLYHELQLLYPLAFMMVLAGILMSARLYLNAHKPAEVWVGALLGFTVSIASVFFFSFI